MNIIPSHIPVPPAPGLYHAAPRSDVTAAEETGTQQQDRYSPSDRNSASGAEKGSATQHNSSSNGNGPHAAGSRKAPDGHELSAEEVRQLEELQARDREVHAHEQAHIAAGGRYVRSGASYHYQTGPDGKKYAIGGEVSIDTSEENDPRATMRKMETVRKAALAPARPSAQDRAIAAQASRKMAEASAELARMQAEGEDRSQQAGKNQQTDGRSAGEISPAETSPNSDTETRAPAPATPPVTGSTINAYV